MELKKPTYLILLFIQSMFCLKVFAQYNTNFINYSQTGRSISANLDFEAGSSGLSSRFVDKLVNGGYIDDNLKKESSKNLRASNNFGIVLNYDLSAFLKFNKNIDYLIGFKNQEVFNATYTRDFYDLMFYGNQAFRGKTANLGNCNINALRFQEMKFGAIIHHVDSVGKIGFSVSFLKGEQLFYIKTKANSSLYTSASGNELIFNSNFNMALSDTNNKNLLSFNGIGASADIFFETSYKSKIGKKSVLMVNANNIGFIHWLNNSVQYNSNASIKFTGYNVNSITDLRDSTINQINRDTLLQDLSNARKENFNVNIPTNLVIINKIYFAKQPICLSTGFRYIFNANYKGYVFIEPEYKYKNMSFALHTGYGGYVRINVGLWMMWNNKDWFVRLGSNSLQGYILPKTAYGQGLYFSLAKKIK
jgi:hypothetical protein